MKYLFMLALLLTAKMAWCASTFMDKVFLGPAIISLKPSQYSQKYKGQIEQIVVSSGSIIIIRLLEKSDLRDSQYRAAQSEKYK